MTFPAKVSQQKQNPCTLITRRPLRGKKGRPQSDSLSATFLYKRNLSTLLWPIRVIA
jgi:hypothetical protein